MTNTRIVAAEFVICLVTCLDYFGGACLPQCLMSLLSLFLKFFFLFLSLVS